MTDHLKFGDFCKIVQKRYGTDNEKYVHKVIGTGISNLYVDVPVQLPIKETLHSSMEKVVRCVCCGIDEREIFKYKVSDVEIINH